MWRDLASRERESEGDLREVWARRMNSCYTHTHARTHTPAKPHDQHHHHHYTQPELGKRSIVRKVREATHISINRLILTLLHLERAKEVLSGSGREGEGRGVMTDDGDEALAVAFVVDEWSL